MGINNFYIASKIESWLIEVYELGNGFKAYEVREKLRPGSPLTVAQAAEIMKRIIQVDDLNIQLRRACNYIQQTPDNATAEMRETVVNINKVFMIIENSLCNHYEATARKTLELYLKNKKEERRVYGFGEKIEAQKDLEKKEIVGKLLGRAPAPLNRHHIAMTRWKIAIGKVIEKNKAKNQSWELLHNTVENYYQRVDDEVKNQIQLNCKAQHEILMKRHNALMTWLDLYEAAIISSEAGLNKLFTSIDMSENQKREIIRNLLRVSISAAVTPLVFKVLDPVLAGIGGILKQINTTKGELELEASQQNAIYQMTGFLPDKNTNQYKNAYQSLANESMYDSITRYKKYLNHKINSLSVVNELGNMMGADAKLWGRHTPDQIIRAHRMAILDHAAYRHPRVPLLNPENENALIHGMMKDFDTMILSVYRPLQAQYGSDESLESMHELIDKINFETGVEGKSAQNKNRENALVKALSNEIEISLIVKYLVQNTRYFGCSTYNRQLYHDYLHLGPNDPEVGDYPDDAPCMSLVTALLDRIHRSENAGLKYILKIDKEGPHQGYFDSHPLLCYRITNGIKSLYHAYADPGKYDSFKRRQAMIKAIIQHYFNRDMNENLQRIVVQFAKSHEVEITSGNKHPYDENNLPVQHWLSDEESKRTVFEATKPFIEMTDRRNQMSYFWSGACYSYARNNRILSEVKISQATESVEQAAAKSKKKIQFKM